MKRFATAALIMGIAALLSAQENPISLGGDLYTGYSGTSFGSNLQQGPYVGIDANLQGSWKDPRILNYNAGGNVSKGTTWTGTLSGPQGENIFANSTFLGGSHFPLMVGYSYLYSPSPDTSNISSQEVGFAYSLRTLSLNWRENLPKIPPLEVTYLGTDEKMDFGPSSSTSNSENKNRNILVDTQYQLIGFNLAAGYSNTHNQSDAAGLLVTGNTGVTGTADSQSFHGSATRSLPLTSTLTFTGVRSQSDVNIGGTKSNSEFETLGTSLASRPIERLTTQLNATYFSSLSDFYKSQLLQQPSSADTTSIALLNSTTLDSVRYSGGANFRIGKGFSVNGSYTATSPVDVSTGATAGEASGHGTTAGLNYQNRIHNGTLFASYQRSDSIYGGTLPLATTTDLFTTGYSHSLPFRFEGSGGMNYSRGHTTESYDILSTGWGFHGDASRKISGGRVLDLGFQYQQQGDDYEQKRSFKSESLHATFGMRKLVVTGSANLVQGLAYQFGTNTIFVPGATPGLQPNGLPPLLASSSSSLAANASYQATRRLALAGSLYLATSQTDGSSAYRAKGFDVNAHYRFHQIVVVSGWRMDFRSFSGQTGGGLGYTAFYAMAKRDFRIF